jgi:hypothetical protein
MVLTHTRRPRITRMEEVPTQHLLLAPLDEKLSGVGHSEESELPVVIQVGTGY